MVDYQLAYEKIQQYVEKYVSEPTARLDPPATKKLALQLGVSSVVVYYFFKLIVHRLYLHPANRLPGPKIGWVPFMGNFFQVQKEEAGVVIQRWAKQYGSLYVYHGTWNVPRVVVTDHLLLKQILTINEYDYVKPPSTSAALRAIVGDGLLTSEGDLHRRQRKMLNPAFSVNSLRALVPLMAKPGYRLRDTWMAMIDSSENKVTGENGEVYTEIKVSSGLSLATLDVIGWAFGQDFKSLEHAGTPHQSRLSQAYLYMFKADASTMPVLTFIFPFLKHLPTERNRNMRKYFTWLNEESRRLVQAGIDRAAEAKASGKKNEGSKDLLAIMVHMIDEETGQGFTVEELKDQCLTFLAAGHETTSVSLSWCLWLLAQHQEIQDDLRAEVRTLFHDDDNTPAYEQVNALPLLNNVVRETLRLIPAVPSTSRLSLVPVQLGPYKLPAGTNFYIGPIAMHHSTTIWGDDAQEFNPSRWNKHENIGNAYQYMPFLAGGRQCIGYRFALIEFKILLAIIIKNLQYFEKPDFKITKKQQITWRPTPNMTLWVKPIN